MMLRLAEVNDIPEIMELVRGVVPVMNAAGNFQWDEFYPNAAVFERDIALAQLWICEADSIAGVAAITTDQEFEYKEVGWDLAEEAIVVHRLAVGVDYQGRGVAGSLMNKAEALAIERGINVLRVDTSSANPATQRLFPKLGYKFGGRYILTLPAGANILLL